MRGKLTERQKKELRRLAKEHDFAGGLIAWGIYKKLIERGYVAGVQITRTNPTTGKAISRFWHNELTAKGRKALGMKPELHEGETA